MSTSVSDLNSLLGQIDLYLLDQLLKNRISKEGRLLDAGCGEGRNLTYFMRAGYAVYGIDRDPEAIRMCQFLARSLNYEPEYFLTANIQAMPFPDKFFQTVICNAVLHFSDNRDAFRKSIREMSRVLTPGGLLFIRMAATMGLDHLVPTKTNQVYEMEGGGQWYLLGEQDLDYLENDFEFAEPVKSVLVDKKRSMSVLIMHKKKG